MNEYKKCGAWASHRTFRPLPVFTCVNGFAHHGRKDSLQARVPQLSTFSSLSLPFLKRNVSGAKPPIYYTAFRRHVISGRNTEELRGVRSVRFSAEVIQYIPNKGEHQIKYYGWYSNKKRGMREKEKSPLLHTASRNRIRRFAGNFLSVNLTSSQEKKYLSVEATPVAIPRLSR